MSASTRHTQWQCRRPARRPGPLQQLCEGITDSLSVKTCAKCMRTRRGGDYALDADGARVGVYADLHTADYDDEVDDEEDDDEEEEEEEAEEEEEEDKNEVGRDAARVAAPSPNMPTTRRGRHHRYRHIYWRCRRQLVTPPRNDGRGETIVDCGRLNAAEVVRCRGCRSERGPWDVAADQFGRRVGDYRGRDNGSVEYDEEAVWRSKSGRKFRRCMPLFHRL